jgi:hypothetical protein
MSEIDDEKREELLEDTKESYQEAKEQQNELKEAIAEEHAGEKIETTTQLAGDVTVEIELRLRGELIDRIADVEAEVEHWEQDDPSFRGASNIADDCSQILADAVTDPNMNKSYFYEIYEELGLQALGALVRTVLEAVEAEQERMQGAVEGFRE